MYSALVFLAFFAFLGEGYGIREEGRLSLSTHLGWAGLGWGILGTD
jgi:hypothetical protein